MTVRDDTSLQFQEAEGCAQVQGPLQRTCWLSQSPILEVFLQAHFLLWLLHPAIQLGPPGNLLNLQLHILIIHLVVSAASSSVPGSRAETGTGAEPAG